MNTSKQVRQELAHLKRQLAMEGLAKYIFYGLTPWEVENILPFIEDRTKTITVEIRVVAKNGSDQTIQTQSWPSEP